MSLIDGIAKAVGLAQGSFSNPYAKEITERNGAPVTYDRVNRDNFTLDQSPFKKQKHRHSKTGCRNQRAATAV